jgi:hypothetical protein
MTDGCNDGEVVGTGVTASQSSTVSFVLRTVSRVLIEAMVLPPVSDETSKLT